MEEGYDINISTPNNPQSQSIIAFSSSKPIILEAPTTYTKDLNAIGTIIANSLNVNGIVNGVNIGVKSPIVFTTNGNMIINGASFSVYDIHLRKYTKSILLDGYNIRHFRLRHWPAGADFETGPLAYQYNLKRYMHLINLLMKYQMQDVQEM
jgi:hypothetical protein